MKALRSSPFLSPASALQLPILVCCFDIGALAPAGHVGRFLVGGREGGHRQRRDGQREQRSSGGS